jgi:hypothetical protein
MWSVGIDTILSSRAGRICHYDSLRVYYDADPFSVDEELIFLG